MALVDKLIWHLERHLSEPVTTATLADLCAVSPYHMNRAFRVATGRAPMTYLRLRRLSVAALALAYGKDDILPIALEAQYGSHEAFTRAFATAFGCLPSDVRSRGSTETLTLQEPFIMSSDAFIDLDTPDIIDYPTRRLAGFSIPCSHDKIGEIPALWDQFNKACDTPDLDPAAAYGVSYNVTPEGAFDYMAAGALSGAEVPEGMDVLEVPAGRYAVFSHNGHVSDMPKMFHTIWNRAIPDAGLTPRNAPEYEFYDHRFNGQTGRGTLVVAIPVE